MFIENTCKKPLGFGAVIVLPTERGELPEGYDKEHPVIKVFLEKGWIKEVNGEEVGAKAAETQKPEEEKTTAEPQKVQEEKPVVKSSAGLNKMTLEELRDTAIGLGIELDEVETKESIKQKITEKNQSE